MEGPHVFDAPPVVVLAYAVFDELLPRCDPSEWKVVCAVLRHQREPTMSVSQLMRWTGLASRDGCHRALKRCVEKGYLARIPRGSSFHYAPNPDLAFA